MWFKSKHVPKLTPQYISSNTSIVTNICTSINNARLRGKKSYNLTENPSELGLEPSQHNLAVRYGLNVVKSSRQRFGKRIGTGPSVLNGRSVQAKKRTRPGR